MPSICNESNFAPKWDHFTTVILSTLLVRHLEIFTRFSVFLLSNYNRLSIQFRLPFLERGDLSLRQYPWPCRKSLNASAIFPGCSSMTMAQSWTLIQLVFEGLRQPFRVTVSSTKGLKEPTMFRTGT